jgi:hypothetical protein
VAVILMYVYACAHACVQDVNYRSRTYEAGMSAETLNATFSSDLVMHLMLWQHHLGAFQHVTWSDVLRCPVGVRSGFEMQPVLAAFDDWGLTGLAMSRARVADMVAAYYLAAGFPNVTPHGGCDCMCVVFGGWDS